MVSDDEPDSGHASDLEPIPEELQEISTEELVESDYEAVPPSEQDEVRAGRREHFDVAAMSPLGRAHLDDSVKASSENPERPATRAGTCIQGDSNTKICNEYFTWYSAESDTSIRYHPQT